MSGPSTGDGSPEPSSRSENAAVCDVPSVRSRNPTLDPRNRTPSAPFLTIRSGRPASATTIFVGPHEM